MRASCLAFVVFILFVLIFLKSAFAVAPSMTSYPDIVTADNSFSIQSTMSGLSKNTIYRIIMTLAQMGTAN